MVPQYPFTVSIVFQPVGSRPSVTRRCADLPSAMAIYEENKGRANVLHIEVTLTLHQHANPPIKNGAKRHG